MRVFTDRQRISGSAIFVFYKKKRTIKPSADCKKIPANPSRAADSADGLIRERMRFAKLQGYFLGLCNLRFVGGVV